MCFSRSLEFKILTTDNHPYRRLMDLDVNFRLVTPVHSRLLSDIEGNPRVSLQKRGQIPTKLRIPLINKIIMLLFVPLNPGIHFHWVTIQI